MSGKAHAGKQKQKIPVENVASEAAGTDQSKKRKKRKKTKKRLF